MDDTLLLLPQPRSLTYREGNFSLAGGRLIALTGVDPQMLRFAAQRLQRCLHETTGATWPLVAGTAAPADQVGITVSVVPGGTRHPQGYELTVTPEGIFVVGATPAGAFYGVLTLCQIINQRPRELPALRINDWPDFPHRGVMLDISRDKVPTLETLLALVDRLASWKINQFQLYTEHTFAYLNHPVVWQDASPLTGEEILALDAFCRERFVELVPNQNAFGHMHRWLIHERYRPLAEVPAGGFLTRWGYFREPFSLCPVDPGSLDLVRSLFDELLPHFSSPFFNVGCDETIDLGLGRSREAVERAGQGEVYLDFLLAIYREVKARGRTMQFWGDIIMEHPDLVPRLPHDVIALEWGYEANHPFDTNSARFAASGVPFYVCPGTSSWLSIAGRTENAIGNLRNAAENGLKHGAVGFLTTDWGDYGHWQPLPASELGYAFGAALAWACDSNRDLDLPWTLSRYAFEDPSGTMGRVAYDLGNVYTRTGIRPHNASLLFLLLQMAPEQVLAIRHGETPDLGAPPPPNRLRLTPQRVEELRGLTVEGLAAAATAIDEAMRPLAEARMSRPDADLIRREFRWAAEMLRHAIARGLWLLQRAEGKEEPGRRDQLAQQADELIAKFQSLWLARNRPGGLRESLARMEAMRADYLQGEEPPPLADIPEPPSVAGRPPASGEAPA